MTVDGWAPLVHGQAAERAEAAVAAIAASLRTWRPPDPSLAGGAAGAALFFSYLAEVTGHDEDGATAVRLLETAIDASGDDDADAGLFEGRTGVSWVVAHLDGRLLDLGEDDPNVAMDAALLALLEHECLEVYDLVSGLVGLGVYALERLPRAEARAVLDGIVARLAELAEDDAWFTPPHVLSPDPRRLSPSGHWDLGMAHGAAGVVALLAHAGAGRQVDGAAAWLVGQRLPPGSGSRYAAWLAPGQSPRPARTAWCYGDPGIAAALLAAGRRDEALELAHAAARRPRSQTGVVDAGLCHGAAGLLHVFNRLHHATGDESLAEAARQWFDEALVLPIAEPGFLAGQAGLGLALLAAASDVEPAWDRLLLLSGPA